MSGQTTISTRGCHCFHCKKGGLKRSDLTDHSFAAGAFLCDVCRTMPGVQGQRLTQHRGLQSGSVEYWEDTINQLNVVTDDEPPDFLLSSDVTPARKERSDAAGFKRWRGDVFASPLLDADTKLYLLALAEFADHRSGGNCFPSRETIATTLGCTQRQVRGREKKAKAAGWVTTHATRYGRKKSTLYYQFLNPLHAWAGPQACSIKRRAMIVTSPGAGVSHVCHEPGR